MVNFNLIQFLKVHFVSKYCKPDQTTRNAASILVFLCLPNTHKKDAAVRSKAVVLLLLTFCSLLLPLLESVIIICFVVRCFVSVLVLQSS